MSGEALLDKLFDGEPNYDAPLAREPLPTPTTAETFLETCPSCRGSGVFRSYSGRTVGSCFKCKGKGKLAFKTSSETRAKARASAQLKKEQAAAAFGHAHPQIVQWIAANAGRGFEFADSLNVAVKTYGSLTDKQIAAVERMIARDETRRQERATQSAARAAAAPVVSVAAIETAFTKATESKIKRPKLRLDTFVFSMAPATGKNAGSIYVKEGEQYLGKITGGKFFRTRECDDATEARIVVAAADPANAAKAYGQRFGACSVCGRELTKGISIDLGIGPICAAKYGWG